MAVNNTRDLILDRSVRGNHRHEMGRLALRLLESAISAYESATTPTRREQRPFPAFACAQISAGMPHALNNMEDCPTW